MKIVTAIILQIILLIPLIHAQETVRITTGAWPPYFIENDKHSGIAAHIITEAFKTQNIKVAYGWFPAKRCLLLVESGHWDGTAVWSRSNEREKKFLFSRAVLDIKEVFFHLKEKPFNWQDYSDLDHLKVGTVFGYYYGEGLKKAIDSKTITPVAVYGDLEGITALINKKLDVFVCDMLVGYTIANNNFDLHKRSLMTHHPKPVNSAPHYIMFNKKSDKSPKLVQAFQKGMDRIIKNGKYDAIIKQAAP